MIVSDGEGERGRDGNGPGNNKTSLLYRQTEGYGGYTVYIYIVYHCILYCICLYKHDDDRGDDGDGESSFFDDKRIMMML